jgi:WD40 repeat protein
MTYPTSLPFSFSFSSFFLPVFLFRFFLFFLSSSEGEEGGHVGGVTQVEFHPEGNLLFSGGRKDNLILGWDIRNTCKILYKIPRKAETNQRFQFHIDPLQGRYLATASQDKKVKRKLFSSWCSASSCCSYWCCSSSSFFFFSLTFPHFCHNLGSYLRSPSYGDNA